jgi:outer membrane protein assembly factor BamD
MTARTARPFLSLVSGGLILCLLLPGVAPCNGQILHRKKKINKSTAADNNVQPDKVLYDRALNSIKHSRYEVCRLSLQTLINTYPDSEYLAKAKLLIADAYYKEGGTANMTQAIAAYKDFGVFFPFLQEAAYAQLQVANTHYRLMEKPDRDRSEARDAEQEFQTFLQKYSNDPLAPQAEQRLRDVQEVLAEGDYRVGYYYYVKGDRQAAAARLIGVTRRYPLYSRSDRALWMLGDIFEKSEKKEIASLYYAQIMRNYPKSVFVPRAKDKLTTMKVPIPQPDPKALSWMTAEQNAPHTRSTLVKKPLAIFKSGPVRELQTSARVGAPNLQPEADSTSATDILTGGNHSSIGGTGIVATVTPGGSAADTPGADSAAPASDGSGTAGPTDTAAPADTANPPAAAATPESGSSPTPTTASASTTGQTAAPATPDSKKNESSSKKKKGLRKMVPW